MMLQRTLLSCSLLLALLAGCNKTDAPPKPSATGAEPAKPADQSVATPAPALPPSDASTPPASSAPDGTASQQSQSQATPGGLSGQQEKGNMPLAGQANDHSNLAPPQEVPKGEPGK